MTKTRIKSELVFSGTQFEIKSAYEPAESYRSIQVGCCSNQWNKLYFDNKGRYNPSQSELRKAQIWSSIEAIRAELRSTAITPMHISNTKTIYPDTRMVNAAFQTLRMTNSIVNTIFNHDHAKYQDIEQKRAKYEGI